jgi:Cu/Ag efflux protein CusF
MKKFALLGVLALSASVALAQQPPAAPPSDAAQAPAPGAEKSGDSKQMTGQVVSVDVPGKTITVKKDAADMTGKTLAVDTAALTTLKSIYPGDKVKLTWKTDANGKETVQTIEKDKSSAPNPQ